MNYIVIVAGGKGQRMGNEVPKQFLLIGKKPILMYTIERFHEYDKTLKIILVLPEEQQNLWKELCSKYSFTIEHQIVNGGTTRFESSLNGLSQIPEGNDGLVGIHDGVRPFVSVNTIKRCYDEAQLTCAVIPVMPLTESLRIVEKNGNSKSVERANYYNVQNATSVQYYDGKNGICTTLSRVFYRRCYCYGTIWLQNIVSRRKPREY